MGVSILKLEGRMKRPEYVAVVTGIYAHIGCQATAVEAFMRDVAPFLVADAVADFSRHHHDAACEYVAQRCGVVTGTADVLEAFAGAPVGVGG